MDSHPTGSLIADLCKKHTDLAGSDIAILEDYALKLPAISDLTGNDIFIDALTRNNMDAIVLAWARPKDKSLYSESVVGQLAFSTNEPAMYRTLTTGEPSRDVRGVSQEGVPIAQTVVPICNSDDKTIGVLIMERDISKELWQEKQVEFLSQSAERLSRTLMYLSMTESRFDDWLGNAIFILNKQGKVTYANKYAASLFESQCGRDPLGNVFYLLMPEFSDLNELLSQLKDAVEKHFGEQCYRIRAHPLVSYGTLDGCAISIKDITDLRRKEQELNAKSVIIREIHHRVKNNLQNIASLLMLQANRSASEVVKTEFADSINRIMSIAMVHDVFACQSWDSINLIELCQRILDSVISHAARPGHKITTRVEGRHIQLTSKLAVPLALVINELVTNAMKHGVGARGEGEIAISLKEDNGFTNLLVTNNSPEPAGPLYFDMSKKCLGLQIVDSLVCEQLKGYFRLERVEGLTRAMVCFPRDSLEGES